MESQSEFENDANPLNYEEVAKSTATIVHEGGIGSGFFIEKNLLVTNYHVIEGAKDGGVFFRTQEGIKDIGDVAAFDVKSDLAIVRTLRNNYQALEIGSDERLKMGDEIFVIGSPEGLDGTLSEGIISAQRRGDRIQITAPISPGSSGSPVFSKDFKVIGIAVGSVSEGQNLNFAVLVSKLQELMQKNKVALERVAPEEVARHSDSNFDKELASYENKEDKTPPEIFKLGVAYYSEENYKKAFHWYEKAANQGHVKAQHNLGLMYYEGKGVVQDYEKAFYWFEKAANQGTARSQYNLGVMYNKGEGVAKNHQEALYWYQKAADQGHAETQHNLGAMYYKSKGVAQDYEKAFYWYEKAANQGHVNDQLMVGLMYYRGKGVAKDYEKAFHWYEKAANQGHVNGQIMLGLIYHMGEGVTKDYKKAVYWYQKAANQGNVSAQFMLGGMYHIGDGVVKNYIQAYKWIILAKAQSVEADEKVNEILDSLENKALDSLEKLMTPAQIAEAQKLANQFEAQSK